MSSAHGVLLDVGCGLKPYEKFFAPYVKKYYGTEYSPESGFRGNRADVAGDASAMPFADASVNTILCTEVLEHVAHPEKVIEEFARILKPDGIIITTAPFFTRFTIHSIFFATRTKELPSLCGGTVWKSKKSNRFPAQV